MPVTTEGRVALYLQDKHPIREGMEYVRYAEERGFEAVWQAESRLVREATVPMAAFAAVTDRIKIGSGVVNTWTRNVGLLAATFATLDELAPGRIILGIGAWWEPLASKVGARSGRDVEEIDRPQLVGGSLDEDRDLALDRARELVTQYLGQQPHIMKASGVDQSVLDDIARVLTWPAGPEEIRRAMTLVPDEVVQLITASGTPDECRAKVREYVQAGATCPVLYPLGDDVRAMIEAFAWGKF